jgi:hypothetical protein
LLEGPAGGEKPLENFGAREVLSGVFLDAAIDEGQAVNRDGFSGRIAPHLLHLNARISGKFRPISVGRLPFMEPVCQRFER